MKYIKIVLGIILAIIFLFVLSQISGRYILPDLYTTNQTDVTNTSLSPDEKLLNKKAPYFDLSDHAGNRIKLSNFLDTPLILVFWATWNKESTDQIKIFDDYLLSKNIQHSLVKVVAINSLEEASVAKSYIRRGGYGVSVAHDTIGDVSNLYNIKSLPTIYFINRDGIIQEIYLGVLSQAMIVDKANQILR